MKKKSSLKEVMNNMLPVFVIYKAVYIDERSINLIVIGSKNMSLLWFLESYISAQYLIMIFWYININTKLKCKKVFNDILKSGFEYKIFSYFYLWKETTEAKIRILLEILFI